MLSERKESLLIFQRKFTFFSSLKILKYLFVCTLQLCGLKTATNPTELVVFQFALNLLKKVEKNYFRFVEINSIFAQTKI